MNELWNKQLEFNIDFFKKNNIDFLKLDDLQKNKYTKEFILHISREIFEVLNEIPFKMHRDYKDFELKKDNIIEELVDVQKYLFGLFQIWDVSYDKFFKEFIRKSNVVRQRFNQEFNIDLDNNKKIIIFDIDGVLAKYPEYFIEFINNKNNTDYKTMYDIKNCLDKKTIYKLKDDYRQSGYKRTIPIKEDSIEFINSIDRDKYNIVLLTSRPYSKYLRIYADTLEWLDSNNINYDFIFWDEKKDRKILNNFNLDKIEFVVEDNLYFSNKISQINIKVFLLDNIYNQGHTLKNVYRIKNIKEILFND